MPFRKSPLIDSIGVAGMAQDWGKIVARRVHEEVGPDPDLDADDAEDPLLGRRGRLLRTQVSLPDLSSGFF